MHSRILTRMMTVGAVVLWYGVFTAATPAGGRQEHSAATSPSPAVLRVLSALAELPPPTQMQILRTRHAFISGLARVMDAPPELTWLVDKTHPLSAAYKPDDLVRLTDYSPPLVLNRPTHQVRALIMDDLLEMVRAAEEEGIELQISSTYRSYDDQARIYAYWVDQLGQEEADRVSARPGYSQHQLGTTIDFGCICPEFATTRAGTWMAEHAWSYGFSMSYPAGYEPVTGYDYESWHFRYIGRAAAALEHYYFAGVQQYLLEFLNRIRRE
jgi:zinc D-Ala-D-Ala carboxypeptidase